MKPTGITVHYTADRDAARTVRSLVSSGLGYHFLIGRDGTIFQLADTSLGLSHAGKAIWNGASPNRSHVAISMLSWGKLVELAKGAYVSWNGLAIKPNEISNKDGHFWDFCPLPQEASLVALLIALCFDAKINPANICGHSECAIPSGRKADPGGVLSHTMDELRGIVVSATEEKGMEV